MNRSLSMADPKGVSVEEGYPQEKTYLGDNAVFHITDWLEDARIKSWIAPECPPTGTLTRRNIIHSLENKVEELKILEQQVNILRMKITKDQATLSPIRLIPPEILAEIFCILAAQCWMVPYVVERNRRNPYGLKTSSKIEILLVCRQWRDLAMATPSFWIHIRLCQHSLSQGLLHSKSAHIHLDNRWVPAPQQKLAKILAPHSARVESLSDDLASSIFLATSQLPGAAWNNLLHLRLGTALLVWGARILFPSDISLPLLSSLYIDNCQFHHLPRFIYPKLKLLSLFRVISSFDQLLSMVESTSELHELRVAIGNQDIETFRLTNDMQQPLRLALSKLEALEVGGHWPYHAILPFCVTLKHFSITGLGNYTRISRHDIVVNDSVQTFRLDGMHDIGIHYFEEQVSWWQGWLYAFPSLRYIFISGDKDHPNGVQYSVEALFDTLAPPREKTLSANQFFELPPLVYIQISLMDVEILSLFQFAKSYLVNDNKGSSHGQTSISKTAPITLTLSDCRILNHRNEDSQNFRRGPCPPIFATFTTWQEFEEQMRIYAYPELTEKGWGGISG